MGEKIAGYRPLSRFDLKEMSRASAFYRYIYTPIYRFLRFTGPCLFPFPRNPNTMFVCKSMKYPDLPFSQYTVLFLFPKFHSKSGYVCIKYQISACSRGIPTLSVPVRTSSNLGHILSGFQRPRLSCM